MKIKLKKIEPLKAGYVSGLLYLLISVIIIVPFTLLGSIVGTKENVLGMFVVIIIPIIYGIVGFLGGLITAALYNFVAKNIGGLEIEVEKIEDFTEK